MTSNHGATAVRPPLPVKTVLHHMVPTFLMGLFMTVLYLAGFHHPQPRELPVAVVGSGPQVDRLRASIASTMGDRVTIEPLTTEAAAQDALRHLEIVGAYIPGSDSARLLVAPAASDTSSSTVERIFHAVSARTGMPMAVKDVAPLPAADPVGQNGFFFLVVLSVMSYALAIAVAAAGASRTMRDRLLIGLGTGIVVASLETAIAAWCFDLFEGHELAIWALALLYSLAVMAIGIGLHPILKRYSTMALATMFVGLNFTSSGGVFQPHMQSAFFEWFNRFWIGAAFIDAHTRIMYFPEVSITRPVWTLVGWMAAGVIAVVIGTLVEQRGARQAALLRHRDLSGTRLGLLTATSGASGLVWAPFSADIWQEHRMDRPQEPELDDDTLEELEEDVAV